MRRTGSERPTPLRVSAEYVLHVIHPMEAGQLHGFSHYAPLLPDVQARVAALDGRGCALRSADFAGIRNGPPESLGPRPGLSGLRMAPPRWDWIAPLKDIRAEVEAMKACLKSRSQAISERGYDASVVDSEIAADRQREQTMGIFSSQ